MSSASLIDQTGAADAAPGGARALLAESARVLERAGVPTPQADAELIAGFVLGKSRGEVSAAVLLDRSVSTAHAQQIRELVEVRARRIPLQHITGVAPFRSIELAVGPGVFIPRPETEVLVEEALRRTPQGAVVFDLGTGSGAIALSVAVERPDVTVFAIEKSGCAFVWAQHNRRTLGLENVHLIHADFTAGEVLRELPTPDVVISNPPYVPEGECPHDPEVYLFDPEVALYAGADGLDALTAMVPVAGMVLRSGGFFLCEHTEGQGERVRALLGPGQWRDASTLPDLTGRDRFTVAERV